MLDEGKKRKFYEVINVVFFKLKEETCEREAGSLSGVLTLYEFLKAGDFIWGAASYGWHVSEFTS